MRIGPRDAWAIARCVQHSVTRVNLQCPTRLLRTVHKHAGRERRQFNTRICSRNAEAAPQPHLSRDSGTSDLLVTTATNSISNHQCNTALSTRITDSSLLPTSCPGCGALAQDVTPGEAGYYGPNRKVVRQYLHTKRKEQASARKAHQNLEETSVEEAGDVDEPVTMEPDVEDRNKEAAIKMNPKKIPKTALICDRCHELVYYSRGTSIAHPSIESLADSLAESPFRINHVYHVLDAADFPMSLIPSIYDQLSLAKPRTQNRRSQHKFSSKPTISFVITRSDLLAPRSEMVDSLMTYITSVLRKALGKSAEDIRLGNVHLVSAKRGWWTKEIKASIFQRGGGNWMIGKVNVGKSNLFEVLFPKGRKEKSPEYDELAEEALQEHAQLVGEDISETSLLPPPRPEQLYPALPLVSSLPGTTASPIRLPFANHKGELIDLPGLDRGNLEQYVQPEHKLDLVMTTRPKVEQHTVKMIPNQSLLLGGGLVRITPIIEGDNKGTILLAYPFVPIEAHVTATEKAIGTQTQQRKSALNSMLADDAGEKMASAGYYHLETDVTKARAGALLRAGVLVESLPFRVYATDILIEGVGWVELVCQVRRRKNVSVAERENADAASFLEQHVPTAAPPISLPDTIRYDGDFPLPVVEIFTPEGKHVGQRSSMGAWHLWTAEGQSKRKRQAINAERPRKPMKGAKKREKWMKKQENAVKAAA